LVHQFLDLDGPAALSGDQLEKFDLVRMEFPLFGRINGEDGDQFALHHGRHHQNGTDTFCLFAIPVFEALVRRGILIVDEAVLLQDGDDLFRMAIPGVEIIGRQAALGDGLEGFHLLVRQEQAGRLGLQGFYGAVHDHLQQNIHIGAGAKGVAHFDERLEITLLSRHISFPP